MRLEVLMGFLGSGKTTLMLAWAQRLTDLGRTAAFLVNEAGEVGVDQEVLRDGGLEVRELTAGCICCTLGADLGATIAEIGERYDPDMVVLEASGLAEPAGIERALQWYRGPAITSRRTLGLIDPTRIEELLDVLTPLVEAQITGADELIVTKQDEATPDELALAADTAARLNPDAPLFHVNSTDPASVAALLDHLAGKVKR